MKIIKLVVIAGWIWLMPVYPALLSILALPVIDCILALLCRYKSKQPLSPAKLRRTLAKIVTYETATVLAFIVETNLTGELIPAIKMVTGLIGITELASCLKHLDELGGSPMFASILNHLSPPDTSNKE
jgi:hypothetical protein